VGKSTFLNALLGYDLAPRLNGPCTAAPIEFHYGETLEVSADFKENFERPQWFCKDATEVSERLASLVADPGDRASRQIRKVVVKVPTALLANGLIIADTPGFGVAQTESAVGSHHDALLEYLTRDVSQVFWVVLSDTGIGISEVNFRDGFFREICDDVVVTGCDGWGDSDKEKFHNKYRHRLGPRMPKFHFVSGLQGVQARETDDLCQLEAAGIPLLETRIRELSLCSGRTSTIRDSLIRLTKDVCHWAVQHQNDSDSYRISFWRPDSYARWKACYPNSKLKMLLSSYLKTIR
jgi:GTP-binding protein EngB required for normal cell division